MMPRPTDSGSRSAFGYDATVSSFERRHESYPDHERLIATGQPNDSEWDEALLWAAGLLGAAHEPRPFMIDVRHLRGITATQRARLADWRARFGGLQRTRVTRVAYLVRGPLLRGVLTASFWLRQPRAPTRVFERETDALKWLCGDRPEP